MIKYGCLICFLSLIVMVLLKVIKMKQSGLQAFVFAKTHRSDLCLPPIALFVIYHLFANVFDLPRISGKNLIELPLLEYLGFMFCMLGVGLFLWGLISFKTSFRVGIDDQKPGQLVTTGAFAYTRNPLYVAFSLELIGFFLVFPNLFFLLTMFGGFWLFNRQIKREELFLENEYKDEFKNYCQKVRRYI